MGNMQNSCGLECINPDKAPYRFDEWGEASRKHLKEKGFAVIKAILNQNEITKAESLLWEFLEHQGWKRNDIDTWDSGLMNPEGGTWKYGAGHCDYVWYIRTRQRLVETFADLWSDQEPYKSKGIKFKPNEMITSFDGFSVFKPWYLPNKGKWKTRGNWYHIDQSIKKKPNLDTVQGIVTLYDQDKSTGSTALVPGSHLWWASTQHKYKRIRNIDNGQVPIEYLDQLKAQRLLVCCKAGDLILWDSRTIHCNSPSLLLAKEMQEKYGKNKKQMIIGKQLNDDDTKEQEKPKVMNNDVDSGYQRLLRAASYVCMSPEKKIPSNRDVRKERIEAYQNRWTWSHSAHDGRVMDISALESGLKEQSIDDVKDPLKLSLIAGTPKDEMKNDE